MKQGRKIRIIKGFICRRSLQLHMCAKDCADKMSELVWVGESLFETYRLKVRELFHNGFGSKNGEIGFT